jgi:hypothetical protein
VGHAYLRRRIGSKHAGSLMSSAVRLWRRTIFYSPMGFTFIFLVVPSGVAIITAPLASGHPLNLTGSRNTEVPTGSRGSLYHLWAG